MGIESRFATIADLERTESRIWQFGDIVKNNVDDSLKKFQRRILRELKEYSEDIKEYKLLVIKYLDMVNENNDRFIDLNDRVNKHEDKIKRLEEHIFRDEMKESDDLNTKP